MKERQNTIIFARVWMLPGKAGATAVFSSLEYWIFRVGYWIFVLCVKTQNLVEIQFIYTLTIDMHRHAMYN